LPGGASATEDETLAVSVRHGPCRVDANFAERRRRYA
jgi:hypothetical protein